MTNVIGSYSVIQDEHGVLELRHRSDGEPDQVFRIPPKMIEAIYNLIGSQLGKEQS